METEQTENSNKAEVEQTKKSNSTSIVFVLIAILVIGGIYYFKNMKSASSDSAVNVATDTATNSATQATGPIKEFTVDGSNFKFDPQTITVDKGDTVKLTFKDDDGFHNLVVDGYNVTTKTINTGASDTVTFIADKTGTFEYYCAVGSHREKGMTGTLVVQ